MRRAPSTGGRGLAGAYAAHVLLAGFFLFPLLFMLVSAFKSDELQLLRDMGSLRAFIPCGELSLRNFTGVFAHSSFLAALGNSVFTVTVTVALGLLVNSMLAYALARCRSCWW